MDNYTKAGEVYSFNNDSWIREVQYNSTTKAMLVITEKSQYELQDVPLETFKEFAQAPSKGSYFNRNLKGRYSHEYFD